VTVLDGSRSVAVLRALPGLGDLLCAVPALRSLRAALPRASVTLLGLPQAEWFVQRYPGLVDDLMVVPSWPGIPEAVGPEAALPGFLTAARARGFDLAVQLHGTGTATNELVAAVGATRMAGHHSPFVEPPDPNSFRPWPARGHELDRLLDLMRWLGGGVVPAVLDFPERPDDLDGWAAVRDAIGGRPYACIHPGASRVDRRWPAEGFAYVARALHACSLEVVVTGSQGEADLGRAVGQTAGVPSVQTAGRTSIGALAAILRRAEVVVANDTGVAHLAVAVGTPAVVVITTSDAERWAPKDRERNRVVGRGPGRLGPPDAESVVRAALELARPGRDHRDGERCVSG
jgi:ADP-heptose:LPS heptosyltransferase